MASTEPRRAGGWRGGILLGVVLLGFAVRVAQLGAQSFWFDEGWSWHLASMPLDQMAATTAADRSPAVYYALLGAWMRVAGESEFALRFPSLAADVLSVALVASFARLLARLDRARPPGWAAAVVPALAYALCPYAVWYAQEARMYAQVAMLCLAASYGLARWLAPGRSGGVWLGLWGACVALALHTHYYAGFLLPAHGVIVVAAAARARTWAPMRRWLLAACIALATFAPWLIFSLRGFAYDDGFAFPLNTISGRALEWLRAFAQGAAAHTGDDIRAAVAAGVLALAALGLARERRWAALFVLAALVLVPLFAATATVRVLFPYRSVFHPRYLIFLVPVACVLAAWAATATRSVSTGTAARGLALAALWLAPLAAMHGDPAVARDDVRAATAHVVEALEPGDLVVMSRDNYAVRYYWRDAGDTLVAMPAGLHGVLRTDRGLVDLLNARNPARVRLMLWQDDVVDPQKLIESTLWTQGFQIGEYNFRQIRLPLYRRTQAGDGVVFRPIAADFAGALELRGAWLSARATAGDWFYAVLDWLPRERLGTYKVFVHALDAQGKVRFQQDKLALNDLVPTSTWAPGSPLRDAYAIVVPRETPPGDYTVTVGLYPPDAPSQRLTASQAGAPVREDVVPIGVVRVAQP